MHDDTPTSAGDAPRRTVQSKGPTGMIKPAMLWLCTALLLGACSNEPPETATPGAGYDTYGEAFTRVGRWGDTKTETASIATALATTNPIRRRSGPYSRSIGLRAREKFH